VPLEDMSLDQLVLKVDEHTGKAPFVGGFILVGFPETQEHIEKLKGHGIEFDKIIYLNDTNEEEPGAEIKRRMKDVELFDFEQELEAAQKVLALAKEQLGEENVKEISTNGSEETVLIRIRNEIDPFYLKIDNPDDVRTSGELGEEDKRLPKGDFGDYCPVTYVRDGWLIRGNMEQEVLVQGKTYWLSGEDEANKFKFNPTEFLKTKTG
jgi:adenylate/nucleoside-diphosphate kinase